MISSHKIRHYYFTMLLQAPPSNTSKASMFSRSFIIIIVYAFINIMSMARSYEIHLPTKYSKQISSIESIIGTDEGNRGMKALIIPGDLQLAATTLTLLPPKSTILVLSGFPCCVNHSPPTETDGDILESHRRLMVCIPRECFKTSMATRVGAVWTLCKNPNATIGLVIGNLSLLLPMFPKRQ